MAHQEVCIDVLETYYFACIEVVVWHHAGNPEPVASIRLCFQGGTVGAARPSVSVSSFRQDEKADGDGLERAGQQKRGHPLYPKESGVLFVLTFHLFSERLNFQFGCVARLVDAGEVLVMLAFVCFLEVLRCLGLEGTTEIFSFGKGQ